MNEFLPVLIAAAVIGTFATVFIVAYALMKNKKEALGFDRNMKDGEIVRRLLAYARPHAASFILVGLLMLFAIFYDVISPLMIGRIERLLSSEGFELSRLYSFVAVYATILVVSLVSSYFQAMVLQRVGQKILSKIREDTFVHIESLSHAQLNKIPVGTLVTRVSNDANAISMMFTNLLVNLVKNIFVIIGVFAAMLSLNYMLTLVVLAFVPFVALFTVIFRKFSRRTYRKERDGTSDLNAFLSENLSGMKITQVFLQEEKKGREFDERNMRLYRARRERIMVNGVFRPMIYMLYISSVLAILFFGARGAISGVSFLGQTIGADIIISFYMYTSKFFNPIQNLAEQFNYLQASLASAEKIFAILDTPPAVNDAPDAIELDEVRGEIEFRNVWFAYKEDEWVLRGVSFKVEAGSVAAFVGATGSGKTTILSLLCRNYDVQRGEILLDGVDIRKIKRSSLRRHLGQMLQDVFLFTGSVRSNIVLRDETIDDAAVEEACKYVNADRFISRLSAGLDEPIRERGNNLSAGQRQLLSFARTVAHKPSVMILDEATANIDTETEILIQKSLEKMRSIGTMLVVAHRLSTIRTANKIIVLSGGEIIEEGTHEELLAKRGAYYELHSISLEKEKITKSE